MLWKTSAELRVFRLLTRNHHNFFQSLKNLWEKGGFHTCDLIAWEERETRKMTGNWKSSGNFRSTFFVSEILFSLYTIIIPFESIKKRKEELLKLIFFGKNAGGKTLISSILTLTCTILCKVTTRMARAKLWMFGKLLRLALKNEMRRISLSKKIGIPK